MDLDATEEGVQLGSSSRRDEGGTQATSAPY